MSVRKGPSKEELERIAFSIRPPRSREEIIAEDPLGEFHVWWNDLTGEDITSFSRLLSEATLERDLQQFLEGNPLILVQPLGSGHGRWVIPQKKLGSEYVTDFMIADKSSLGFEWIAVELESPRARLFNKNGDPSKDLNHAIRQIIDWRSWLKVNQNYAARLRRDNGLGLTDIDPDVPGLIIMGREDSLDEETVRRRREMGRQLNIKIHTYDWLLRTAAGRTAELGPGKKRRETGDSDLK